MAADSITVVLSFTEIAFTGLLPDHGQEAGNPGLSKELTIISQGFDYMAGVFPRLITLPELFFEFNCKGLILPTPKKPILPYISRKVASK